MPASRSSATATTLLPTHRTNNGSPSWDAKGWVALTHNSRIRYTPNEKQAVISHRVSLLVIVGQAPYPALAKSFVATRSRVEAFLEKHEAPFIAKVYRASPAELEKNPLAPGSIVLWVNA
jgi:hypothetical protein